MCLIASYSWLGSLALSCFHCCSSAVAVAGYCLLWHGLWVFGLLWENKHRDASYVMQKGNTDYFFKIITGEGYDEERQGQNYQDALESFYSFQSNTFIVRFNVNHVYCILGLSLPQTSSMHIRNEPTPWVPRVPQTNYQPVFSGPVRLELRCRRLLQESGHLLSLASNIVTANLLLHSLWSNVPAKHCFTHCVHTKVIIHNFSIQSRK